MIKIKNKIVYSVLAVALVFLMMVVINIYNERKVVRNYKTISLQKFKEDKFKYNTKNLNKIIKVHISGAVKNPGFYKVEAGIKLNRIINNVIILRKDADLSQINTNRRIYDKDKIIIPHK